MGSKVAVRPSPPDPAVAPEDDIEPGTDAAPPPKKSTRFGQGSSAAAMMTLMASTVGAGTLGLPHAFAQGGILPTLGFSVLIVWLVVRTIIWLRAAALDRGGKAPTSYAELVGGTLGRRAGVAARVFTMLKLLTNSVIFTTVAAELAFQTTSWLRGMNADEARAAFARPPLEALKSWDAFVASPQLLTLLYLLVASPLAYLRRIDSLRHTSLLGMALIMAITVLIAAHMPIECGRESAAPCPWDEAPPALFPASVRAVRSRAAVPLQPALTRSGTPQAVRSLPIMIHTISTQAPAVSVLAETEDKRLSAARGVAQRAIGMSGALYQVVGVFGALTFGRAVPGNVLSAPYPRNALWIGAWVSMVGLLTLGLPLHVHTLRHNAVGLVSSTGKVTPRKRHLLTTLILLCVAALALSLQDIGRVVSVMAPVVSPAVALGFPVAVLLVSPRHSRLYKGAMLVLATGVTVLSISSMFV